MKHSAYSVVVILMAGMLWTGRARTFTTYTDSLSGRIAPPGSSSMSVEADAAGALPGHLVVAVNVTNTDVTGGSWLLVVKQTNADGSITELGTLTGDVLGGTISRSEDGSIASLNSLSVSIKTGSGNFTGAAGGTGTIGGTLSPPSFTGTMSLSF